MIDRLKRTTLKRLGLAAVATGAGVSGSVMASADALSRDLASASDVDSLPLADIQVYTRVSAASNDIEVVIQNAGAHPARITQMTPTQTSTRRGVFDFSSLMREGELTLAAGEQVSVGMTPHPVVLDASTTSQQRAASLSAALRRSFSVVTENDAFARVTVADGPRFV